MKLSKNAEELVLRGLSYKTITQLNESEINSLHKKFIKEAETKNVTQVTYDPSNTADQNLLAKMGVHVDPSTKKISMTQSGGQITKEEMVEDETDQDALGDDALQDLTGQEFPHMASDMAPDGMDDDSDNNRKMMGLSENKKKKLNPWAICTAQLGQEFGTTERSDWSKDQMNKYERCVQDVKKSKKNKTKKNLKEDKDSISLFLEEEITNIVKKHLPAKITKGELMNYLSESPTTAPTKPTTKPTTKPGTRPSSPGKNPFPGTKPSPKAKGQNLPSAEEAQDALLGIIKNIIFKK